MKQKPRNQLPTADTVTDKQIRELRDEMKRLVQECNLALNLPRGFDRDMWRSHCAKILNARNDTRLR